MLRRARSAAPLERGQGGCSLLGHLGPACAGFLAAGSRAGQACYEGGGHRFDCAKPNAFLGHSTERDDQLARELPIVSTKTHTRLLARKLHGLEAVEAARSWEGADDKLQKVMLSSGGPGNGSMWLAPTKSARDLLPGARFMVSTVLRRGCESKLSGRLCALLKYPDDPESQCAPPLDSRLHHTLTCKAGLARLRQNREIAATLKRRWTRSGQV